MFKVREKNNGFIDEYSAEHIQTMNGDSVLLRSKMRRFVKYFTAFRKCYFLDCAKYRNFN